MGGLFDLTGDAALVTGGSTGLGRQMARALAMAGAQVAILSRRRDAVTAAAEALAQETGRTIVPLVGDVTEGGQIERAVDEALAHFGKIDVLVNNAGVNIREPIERIRDEHWRRIWHTNVTGVMICCRAVVPHMRRTGYGRIINIGSALSLVGLAERTGYAASKGAVLQITRTLAVELAREGITVNCICPGPFATEINRPVLEDPAKSADLLAHVPMGRWGRLEEIEAPVVFLASRAAGYVTGACLSIDGGWTAA